MLTIAEKVGFMKARAVKVCAKAGITSSPGPKNLVFHVNLQENCLGKEKSWLFT